MHLRLCLRLRLRLRCDIEAEVAKPPTDTYTYASMSLAKTFMARGVYDSPRNCPLSGRGPPSSELLSPFEDR